MTTDPVARSGGLVERAKNILLTPRAEWDRIAAEPANVGGLYMGYLLPLAVLSAVCGVIGMVVFGVGGFGFVVRLPLIPAIINGVVQVIMAMIGAFVLAMVIDALAPTFGSTKNQGQAQKLAVYSSTAGLLAGVFLIFPPLAILGIVGLYSLALLYLGLPRLMKTPEDKRVGYFVTIIIACIVIGVVFGAVMGAVRMSMGGFGAPGGFGQVTQPATQGQITLPGGGSVNTADIEAMSQAATQAAQQGQVAAIDPTRLQGMLPETLPGGFARTSLSSGSAMGVTNAEAQYARGDARITLALTHMGQMGGLAAMAGAANVQQSQQDADGYNRTNTVNGRMISESVSRSANSASYTVVGRGVSISANGSGASIEETRGAAESVGIERLERALGS